MDPKNSTPAIRIGLTAEQQAQVKQQTGREVTALKLEALEARLSPGLGIN